MNGLNICGEAGEADIRLDDVVDISISVFRIGKNRDDENDTCVFILKIFEKLLAIVWFLMPYRVSLATTTQSLPFMATTHPPLYSKIDCR